MKIWSGVVLDKKVDATLGYFQVKASTIRGAIAKLERLARRNKFVRWYISRVKCCGDIDA